MGVAATSAGGVALRQRRRPPSRPRWMGAEQSSATDDCEHALDTELVGARCVPWEVTGPPASATSGANGLGVARGACTARDGWVGERGADGADDEHEEDEYGVVAAGVR